MLYLIANGAIQTTSAFAPVTTGTTIKTMLQVKPFNIAKVVEWGISFDGFAAALPIRVELIETDVAGTVTASVDADITKYNGVADVAVPSVVGLTLGTSATGYTATVEGSIASVRNLDAPQFVSPTSQFIKQMPLGREPIIQIAKYGRIRVTASAAVNCYCYLLLEV